MAIPRSEAKKDAILQAALQAVAAHGVAATTSLIAKKAGVAEGTLFRYFATKEELLNDLFLHLSQSLGEALLQGYHPGDPLKKRTQTVWKNYIEWGVRNLDGNNAMVQLAVSEKIRPETRATAMELCRGVRSIFDACRFDGITAEASVEFAEEILSAIAQATIANAARSQSDAASYIEAGFAFMWAGIHGK